MWAVISLILVGLLPLTPSSAILGGFVAYAFAAASIPAALVLLGLSPFTAATDLPTSAAASLGLEAVLAAAAAVGAANGVAQSSLFGAAGACGPPEWTHALCAGQGLSAVMSAVLRVATKALVMGGRSQGARHVEAVWEGSLWYFGGWALTSIVGVFAWQKVRAIIDSSADMEGEPPLPLKYAQERPQ